MQMESKILTFEILLLKYPHHSSERYTLHSNFNTNFQAAFDKHPIKYKYTQANNNRKCIKREHCIYGLRFYPYL